jgi:hypothetical protein
MFALLLLCLGCLTPLEDYLQRREALMDVDGDGFRDAAWAAGVADCDDGDPATHPGAEEDCSEIDRDCDGAVDEDAYDAPLWRSDDDGDGFGDPLREWRACAAPEGAVAADGPVDCDDARPQVHPAAAERCGGGDEDCDGAVDEAGADGARLWYFDGDGDGFGAEGEGRPGCGFDGYSAAGGDCDDGDPDAWPGGVEVCNDGVDGDCDGSSEGCRLEGEAGLRNLNAWLSGAAGDGAGAALSAGDLDGLGGAEVAAAAPGSGRVYVRPAPLEGGALGEGYALAAEGVLALSEVADLDGDGAADLAAGAPEGSPGRVYLAQGPILEDRDLSLAPLQWSGDAEGDGFGTALVVADLGGDGGPDLAIGAPWATHGGGEYEGAVYLFEGPLARAGVAEDADAVVLGGAPWVGAGLSLAAGDLDADGQDDLLLGAPFSEDQAGAVYLVQGPLDTATSLADADAAARGDAPGDALGLALAIGDVDGDGYPDALLGDALDSDGPTAGGAWLLRGPLDAPRSLEQAEAAFSGLSTGDEAGATVALSDVDGDGRADVVLGAPGADPGGATDAGAVYLFYGPVDGARDLDAADLALHHDLAGDRAGVVRAAALDGDGRADLLIGAPGGDAGGVYLLLGRGY